MKINTKDLNIYFMILTTLVLPLMVGLLMQSFSEWKYVSIPIHAFLETSGAVIALTISVIIFMLYHKKRQYNHFHRASFALIAMGTFDFFHAITYPGELFVWLHSLAIFAGGIFFSLVWIPDSNVSKKTYFIAPISLLILIIAISLSSFAFPSIVPQMLDSNKEFTNMANLLNIIGGTMFIFASFYFIKKYLDNGLVDNILFAGHTMLFGSAGLLFFFSSIWDMQWWFWHILRLLAYIISLTYMLRVFYENMIKFEISNEEIVNKNKELENSIKLLEEYKKAVYQGSIISISDLKGNILFANEELLKISEYTQDELVGQPHNLLRDPDTPKSVFKELWDTIQKGKTFKGLIKNRSKSGKGFYTKITIVPIKDENGKTFEYLALRDNVTELVNSQFELQKHFLTDPLTKLNNRIKCDEDLKELISTHIALLNIDNFKNINDFYGQNFGDKVISEISNILLDLTYKYKLKLYRNHGDEFIILAADHKEFDTFVVEITNILKQISITPFTLDNETIILSLSAGVCENSKNITKADLALKEAKRVNKDLMIYNDHLDIEQIFQTNIQWSKKIKDALDDDRIDVALQPIYSNKTKSIKKYEALVRLIDINGDIISPIHFLDVAKRTKLYDKITRRVIKQAFKALSEINTNISINICAEDIFNESTRYYLMNFLKNSNLSNKVTLEIVESEGIENFSIVKEFIQEVQQYGTKIAIDDFGTGYSNFEYLLKLQADYIKIDGSLIKSIDKDQNSYNVVETIVSFGKKNNIELIAEYVSSKEIQEKVNTLEIEYSQGYFIEEPKLLSEIL